MAIKLLATAAAALLVQIIHAQSQPQGKDEVPVWGNPRSECIDKDPKCLEWASNSQCLDNPTWMHPNCMMSCGQCGAIGGDTDIVEDCSKWSKDGECDSNYTWMFFNCPKSCKHTGKVVAAWWSRRSLGLAGSEGLVNAFKLQQEQANNKLPQGPAINYNPNK